MTPSPEPSQNNVAGILALIGANACYVVNDTLVKLVGADLPIGEIILLRGLIASAVIVVTAAALGALKNLHLLLSWPVVLRVLGEVGAALLYLTALLRMPIANAMAVLQAVPLVATIAAIPLLGEEVGWRRWLAVGIGLFGVLLIIR
ncbi:MAG: DMT family transporter, partial [Hyphomicrobiales bacterium]|nr:DMT family transporter [Hyphomicrobiales bacterium]